MTKTIHVHHPHRHYHHTSSEEEEEDGEDSKGGADGSREERTPHHGGVNVIGSVVEVEVDGSNGELEGHAGRVHEQEQEQEQEQEPDNHNVGDHEGGCGAKLEGEKVDGQTEQEQQQRRRDRRSRRKRTTTTNDKKAQKRIAQARKAMIENIVRFSYHTPQTVFEDLITHEGRQVEQPQQQQHHHQSALDDDNDNDNDASSSDDSSLSSLSSDGEGKQKDEDDDHENDGTKHGHPVGRENEVQNEEGSSTNGNDFLTSNLGGFSLPPCQQRDSCLLFVDVSGFTKLSTMLDAENISRIMSTYFEHICQEIRIGGGDVLKFAGDALFAEWKVKEEEEETNKGLLLNRNDPNVSVPLSPHAVKKKRVKALRLATLSATQCAARLVAKYSDFEVSVPSSFANEGTESESVVTMLNVHCGIGVGRLTGIHVSDYHHGDKDGGGDHSHEDNEVELRREYLFLGSAIDQVSKAAHGAINGQVFISPQALKLLSKVCSVPDYMLSVREPLCICAGSTTFIRLPKTAEPDKTGDASHDLDTKLRKYCKRLSFRSLSRIHLQSALYVHPVVRGDLLSTLNVTKREAKSIHAKTETAELRSVYTMFIKVAVSSDLNEQCVSDLRRIMRTVSTELDRFSGQLRQFIYDDKGCVLIAVFGLRGSTFPDMVSNNALPATVSIHKALQGSGVACRIGATFGQVYCGTVGGIRRHEYSVMGAPVNLAARLMESKENNGMLVDESICHQASEKFSFKSLGSVSAKGYSRQIFIYEPLHALEANISRSQVSTKFFGRQAERQEILSMARDILDIRESKETASVVSIVGETGVGKTALSLACLNEVRILCRKRQKRLVSLRANNMADNQRIPFSTLRKSFILAIREMCLFDGSLELQAETVPVAEKNSDFSSPPRKRAVYSINGRKELDSRSPEGTIEEKKQTMLLYLDKLRWAVEKAGYSENFADFIGSSFLGFDIDFQGNIPNANEIIVCASMALLELVGFADLVTILVDDFQWVDDVTYKVLNTLIVHNKLLLICATRNHDKKAMRRISIGLNCQVQITLGPLQMDDIQALATCILGIHPDSIIDDIILEKTGGGLPTLVMDLLAKIKRDGSFTYSEEHNSLTFTDLSSFDTGTSANSTSILQESLLNRFDTLDSGVRKVLQTCAILGNEFSDTDVYSVHPEMDPPSISLALALGVAEMILVELIVRSEDDTLSASSTSQLGGASVEISRTSSAVPTGQRIFEFGHNMWRNTVLGTMLKERKRELHKRIAVKMEENANLFQGRSDLSVMLKLFEHWKSSGDFSKAARIALFVGKRLKDWDLLHQNIDILRDAKDLCFQSIKRIKKLDQPAIGEWVLVSADLNVMNLIIRLHRAMADTFNLLAQPEHSLDVLQDAYTILRSSTEAYNHLMIPILTDLCIAIDELESSADQLKSLLNELVRVAKADGSLIHISNALAMEATFFSKKQDFEGALRSQKELQDVYNVEEHSSKLVKTYGKDRAVEACSQSVLWYFLSGQEGKAIDQAKFVVNHYLPYQDPHDVTGIMSILLPCILVLKMVGRARDALYLLGKYVVNPHHDFAPCEDYWEELFNPLVYLLQILTMEEEGGTVNASMVDAMKVWVLDESHSYFSEHHLRLGHMLMGEICFQLGHFNTLQEDDKAQLLHSARQYLSPIAWDVEAEPFLAHSATAFIQAMDG